MQAPAVETVSFKTGLSIIKQETPIEWKEKDSGPHASGCSPLIAGFCRKSNFINFVYPGQVIRVN